MFSSTSENEEEGVKKECPMFPLEEHKLLLLLLLLPRGQGRKLSLCQLEHCLEVFIRQVLLFLHGIYRIPIELIVFESGIRQANLGLPILRDAFPSATGSSSRGS